MYKSLTAVILPLFFLFPAIVPQSVQAEISLPADVYIKNFPELQHIKGDVQINNFPETQQIKGSVSIEGTTKFIAKEGVVVPTAQRAELDQMVYAGTVKTDGFTSLLITLQGEMRSNVFSTGTIGVLLIPDEGPFLRILRDAKRVLFPIECKAQTKSGDSIYFESEQVQQRIAFSSYRMYLYNTASKQAEANVYLYLSNSPTVNVRETTNK